MKNKLTNIQWKTVWIGVTCTSSASFWGIKNHNYLTKRSYTDIWNNFTKTAAWVWIRICVARWYWNTYFFQLFLSHHYKHYYHTENVDLPGKVNCGLAKELAIRTDIKTIIFIFLLIYLFLTLRKLKWI